MMNRYWSKRRTIGLLAALTLFALAWQNARAEAHAERSHRASLYPPVVNLDLCTPSPDCDYGPIYASYPTYGNVYPVNIGDCTFAAAANWEEIILGIPPDPARLSDEFDSAQGTESGLTQEQFLSYWQQRGIAGVVAKRFLRYSTARYATRDAVRGSGAVIAELSFAGNASFAQYWVSEGLHEVVVDGFTPAGPLVVSWGRTLQMSWTQWHAEAIGMWAIEASR
jgi:hypothetical protein